MGEQPKQPDPTDIERTLNAAGITDPKQRAAYLKQALQKQTTHAPAASQSVQVNTEKDFLGKIGEEAGKEVIAGSGAAKGALKPSSLRTTFGMH